MKIKLFVAREIQYFELGIFSFNSYVYYLTRGFIASTRAFNLLTRAFNLPTRAFNLATRAFSVLTREFELVTREFELVTRGFELVTRVLLFHSKQLLFQLKDSDVPVQCWWTPWKDKHLFGDCQRLIDQTKQHQTVMGVSKLVPQFETRIISRELQERYQSIAKITPVVKQNSVKLCHW